MHGSARSRVASKGALLRGAAPAERRRQMRLEVLHLMAYGPFTARRLEFSQPFTIVYGLNEAGKTSALRALADGLYGIPAQTSDSFIHPYGDLRIGLTLTAGAKRLEFIRRKARLQSLRAADDKSVIEDAQLERLLQGLSRTDFETMFGISHERPSPSIMKNVIRRPYSSRMRSLS